MGAEDCVFRTAVDIELKKIFGKAITTGSIDVFKCFDQIVRPLIYKLAEEAGMPRCVLRAYAGFWENLEIHFQLAGTLGQKHKDPMSIPQGCPFSMTLIALLMRPWMGLMREEGVTPRALADDLLMMAEGKGHGERVPRAMESPEASSKMLGPGSQRQSA